MSNIKIVKSAEHPPSGASSDNGDENGDSVTGLRVGSLLRTWTQISRINYYAAAQPLDATRSGQAVRKSSIGVCPKDHSIHRLVPLAQRVKCSEEVLAKFPVNVTKLMNEDQLWGCFYVFPELYEDVYSPVVPILTEEQIAVRDDGVLTKDLIACCLSYLARSPILGDYVYIKLSLVGKDLNNIDVLKHYKYIVYLDLSDNDLKEISVLSHLPYLQYLSVRSNKLENVLNYEPAQWFLTEVHYKFNMVKKIRDLSAFWSITILDLSRNNIKHISGLNDLMFLRRLDLSFNHIQRLDNLNNLKLVWLDVSYNNISAFDCGPKAGLKTLLDLDYLNINENNLSSLKLFAGCSRLRELHARNNHFSFLLDMALYMAQMQRLTILDFRGSPMSTSPNYKHVLFNTFPALIRLDGDNVNVQDQREYIMDVSPSVLMVSLRRLMRLFYVEQLTRAGVSAVAPPADANYCPIVVIVGYDTVGKGTLVRRLAAEHSKHVERAVLHTTARHHQPQHYHQVTSERFDEMLLAGEFLTYSEIGGHSYGLSREEAFVREGKVRVASSDLAGALVLRHRGLQPYLLLATCSDRAALLRRQCKRKQAQILNQSISAMPEVGEQSSLHTLLTGDVKNILNELLVNATKEEMLKSMLKTSNTVETSVPRVSSQAPADALKKKKLNAVVQKQRKRSISSRAKSVDFTLDSQFRLLNMGTGLESAKSVTFSSRDNDEQSDPAGLLVDPLPDRDAMSMGTPSMKSVAFAPYNNSEQDPSGLAIDDSQLKEGRGTALDAASSASTSKSLTSAAQAHARHGWQLDPAGLFIEPISDTDGECVLKTISSNLLQYKREQVGGADDYSDLWLNLLSETGRRPYSDVCVNETKVSRATLTEDDTTLIMKQLHSHEKDSLESNVKTPYEDIHRRRPGLFWDTIVMDDPNAAFIKTKRIIKQIINEQASRKPLFFTDFTESEHYPAAQERLQRIQNAIAPHRLFY